MSILTQTPAQKAEFLTAGIGSGLATAANLADLQAVVGRSKQANIYVPFGQSLTPGRSPQVTAANKVVPSLFTFAGGPEAQYVTSPAPLDIGNIPIDPNNWAEMVPFVPGNPGNTEPWGPGLGFQSAKAGVPRSFWFAPGSGSMPIRLLHFAHMRNLAMGLESAVRLLRAAAYEPRVIFFFVQGHGDTQTTDDGGNPGFNPISAADYLIGTNKLFATMRMAASLALGYDYQDTIWVTPLLTSNGVSSFAARRQIVLAQGLMPETIRNVRLLPPHSQFANLFETDLTHPNGTAYRYYAEMAAAFPGSGVTAPRIASVAISAGAVAVTFDQPIKYAAVPDAASPGNSRDGFTVIDNTGAEVPVTATSINGKVVTLAVAATTNLTGAWFVRNGLQQLNLLGNVGSPVDFMPRTRVAGTTDVGIAEDGTALQNLSIPQEKQA